MKILTKKRILCLLAFTVLFFAALPAPVCRAAELRFYAIDVGQGDSSLFIFPDGKSMLIDAGTPSSAKALVRYLKECGLRKIDVLVATHPHSDHIGGFPEVIRRFEIGEVWDSGYAHGSDLQIKFYTAIRDKKIPYGRPKRGYTREIGGALVEVLAPAREIKGTKSDANNNSIVLRIVYGDVSFLMTGDMERAERKDISPLPCATVLKAAHHGSRTGTDAQLLRETEPLVIILSYGQGNSYGHPHPEVLRLFSENPRVKRFDTSGGTVKLRTDGTSLIYDRNREVVSDER